MKVKILSSGDYSSYSVIGVFPDPETADRVAAELAAEPANKGGGMYQVEEVDLLPSDVKVETLDQFTGDGLVTFDGVLHASSYNAAKDDPYTSVYRVVFVGEDERPTWKPCEVQTFSASYGHHGHSDHGKMGVRLYVHGTDIERCRKVWTETVARLRANAAAETVAAWVDYSADIDLYLGMPSNADIADAVTRARAGS